MKHKFSAALVAAAALVAVGTGAAQAATTTLHKADIDNPTGLNDIRSSGHYGLLDDGLAIWTDDSSSAAKVAMYWRANPQNLPDAVSMDWSGTQPQPGTQIVFDFDQTSGNGNDYNILVGEPEVYGNDFWLTNGSSADAHGVCPETGGGFGSACHGTLSQWKGAIPNADVYAYGFSLGSGVQGSGVIHDVTVDGTEYRFSGTPNSPSQPVPTDTTGSATIGVKVHPHKTVAHVHLKTDALTAGQSQGRPAKFKVRVGRQVTGPGGQPRAATASHVVYASTMGAGQKASFPVKFRNNTGKHVVTVYVNGQIVKKTVVRTGHRF